jgi:hypothetical protein
LVAAIFAVIGSGRDAMASDGCSAVNAGGFDVTVVGKMVNTTIANFAVGDNLTFYIVIASGGATSWQIDPSNGQSSGKGFPGTYTVPYNVNNSQVPGTTLTQTVTGDVIINGSVTVKATCAPAS